MKIKILAALVCLVIIWVSCTTEETPLGSAYLDLPQSPYTYELSRNNDIATLGRVLFYDRQLSANNSVSCSSCHKQNLAFSDDVAFSKGFDNQLTHRNSMPIQNIGSGSFGFDSIIDNPGPSPGFFPGTTLFWDGREHDLQTMVLKPIINHIEMGVTDLGQLNKKLAGVPYYKGLFYNAYGSTQITTDKIATALSSFLMNITSQKTGLDKHLTQGGVFFTQLESKGFELFLTTYDCNACHQIQNPHGYISAGTFANVGLDAEYTDNGLQGVTGLQEDAGKFKIPSLRNVVLTAPYMHDGRFATLDEVIDHYSNGLADHPNLDTRLTDANGEPMRMNIPDGDKRAIIAFLNTLTDHQMISDPRFSNPFKVK